MFFFFYQCVRAVRYQLAMTVFGFVSHCKHQPTCGTNYLQLKKEKGFLLASIYTAKQILMCW